jgi:hypothetical protein
VSRAQVNEDDGQVLKTAAASSAGPVQEEQQHQEPDGEIQSTFYQICYLLHLQVREVRAIVGFISSIATEPFYQVADLTQYCQHSGQSCE